MSLTPGYFAQLKLLGTAVNGFQAAQALTVNYQTGTQSFTQGFSGKQHLILVIRPHSLFSVQIGVASLPMQAKQLQS